MERKVMFKGKPVTLVGRNLKLNSIAPEFRAVSNEMKDVYLSDFKGKVKILTSFPSLDTPVCDLQVKMFNSKAVELSKDVVIIGISKDLPFAQARFCDANNIKNIKILSDFKYNSFGINYGLIVKELNLLARTVLVLDANDMIRYFQIVEEITNAPDYLAVMSALKEVLEKPEISLETKIPSHCVPCEVGTPPLSKEKVDELIKNVRVWQIAEYKKITKEYKFKDFVEAKYFVDIISEIAEEQGHHPTITIIYDKVKITLTTHASGGLTENDFIMAGIIDSL